jgi:hypothetical protein
MNDNKQMTAVIATFADRRQADHYVGELRRAGFRDGEIGVLAPGDGQTQAEEGAAAGALAGGALGACAGAVATGLIPGVGPVLAAGLLAGVLGGAAVGAAAGGVVGALAGLGVPEEDARRCEREFLAGRTVVVVQALARGAEALEILRRCRAGDPAEAASPVGDYTRDIQLEYEEQQQEGKV